MSGEDATGGSRRDTKTEGAYRAGDGEYFFDFGDLEGIDAGTGYSTSHGPIIEGDRMQVGLIHMSAGTGARPHTHPNEQFIYVLQGTLSARIDGQEADVSEGSVMYIPADVEHAAHATADGDVYFYVVKDLSHGIVGSAIDQSTDEAHYEPGHEPDEE